MLASPSIFPISALPRTLPYRYYAPWWSTFTSAQKPHALDGLSAKELFLFHNWRICWAATLSRPLMISFKPSLRLLSWMHNTQLISLATYMLRPFAYQFTSRPWHMSRKILFDQLTSALMLRFHVGAIARICEYGNGQDMRRWNTNDDSLHIRAGSGLLLGRRATSLMQKI